jgi:hypothetical protein
MDFADMIKVYAALLQSCGTLARIRIPHISGGKHKAKSRKGLFNQISNL